MELSAWQQVVSACASTTVQARLVVRITALGKLAKHSFVYSLHWLLWQTSSPTRLLAPWEGGTWLPNPNFRNRFQKQAGLPVKLSWIYLEGAVGAPDVVGNLRKSTADFVREAMDEEYTRDHKHLMTSTCGYTAVDQARAFHAL